MASHTNTKSQARARWAPGPTATPCTAATVGLSSSHSSRIAACTPARRVWEVDRGSKPSVPALDTVESRRSMPEQKASPVAANSTHRTSSSARAERTAATRSSRIAGVRALAASGRSRVMRPTASAVTS